MNSTSSMCHAELCTSMLTNAIHQLTQWFTHATAFLPPNPVWSSLPADLQLNSTQQDITDVGADTSYAPINMSNLYITTLSIFITSSDQFPVPVKSA